MSAVTDTFCDGVWHINGFTHRCVKPKGHNGACWCCDGSYSEGTGGDLAPLATMLQLEAEPT